jgi:F-type H+-transporting ATPase subunit epsilon
MAKTFTLEIVTPERSVFSGPVRQVIVPCFDGYLGVMAGHAAFLGVLRPGELLVETEGKRQYCSTSGGFVEVTPKSAMLLSEAVEFIDAIDVPRAEKSLLRAKERIVQKPEGVDPERARKALDRAENRLRIARKRRG